MLAHGFKAERLAALVGEGLATTQPGTVSAGRRQMEVVWVMITEAGSGLLPDGRKRRERTRGHPTNRLFRTQELRSRNERAV
jgi:hypothetical protein